MKTQLPKVVLVVVSALLARSAAASPAAGQAPQGLAASSRTLCGAQDEGELRVSDVVEALAGEDAFVASTAAAIVRHEWRDLPGEFFAALNKSPVAARRFLEELVIAPRPSAAAWAALQMQPGQQRSLSHRLMALVARRQPVTKVEAQRLLGAAQLGQQVPRERRPPRRRRARAASPSTRRRRTRKGAHVWAAVLLSARRPTPASAPARNMSRTAIFHAELRISIRKNLASASPRRLPSPSAPPPSPSSCAAAAPRAPPTWPGTYRAARANKFCGYVKEKKLMEEDDPDTYLLKVQFEVKMLYQVKVSNTLEEMRSITRLHKFTANSRGLKRVPVGEAMRSRR